MSRNEECPTVRRGVELVTRASHLAEADQRVVLGITGPPGGGKSLVSNALVTALRTTGRYEVSVLPMDGFHMTNTELAARGMTERKGSQDTFEVDAFVAKLRDVVARCGSVTWPEYSRVLHDPRPDVLEVGINAQLVIVEGNYLSLDIGAWSAVQPLLTETWFVDAEARALEGRLLRRHTRGGMPIEDARRQVIGVDLPNGDLIRQYRRRADVSVALPACDPLFVGVDDPATGMPFCVDPPPI